MKQAYITVHNDFLETLLKLPEDIRVETVVANGRGSIPNTFIVILKGDGLPEPEIKEGEISQHVTIVYEKNYEDLVPNVRLKEIKKAI